MTNDLEFPGDSVTRIEEIIGHTFKDKALLERAFTHRSAQTNTRHGHYERLEFLGDAVLDLAVSHLLLEHHPDLREGDLSKMRAALVNTASLAEVSRELGIGNFIQLSKGEAASGGAERSSILADVFEALIGALYRDAGFDAALSCVRKLFERRSIEVLPRDPKTELQEALHALGHETPIYELEKVVGPEHAPLFVSSVRAKEAVLGVGEGTTKKASQQAAAEQALEKMKNEKFKS